MEATRQGIRGGRGQDGKRDRFRCSGNGERDHPTPDLREIGIPPLASGKPVLYVRRMPYTITIDRSLCAGYGDCVGLAPEVFEQDGENISVVIDPEGAADEAILDAARACPVDAITLVDQHGDQEWP